MVGAVDNVESTKPSINSTSSFIAERAAMSTIRFHETIVLSRKRLCRDLVQHRKGGAVENYGVITTRRMGYTRIGRVPGRGGIFGGLMVRMKRGSI